MSGTPKQVSHPRVFISYSHDSQEHSRQVLQLANSLRSRGIDAELDQYHMRPPHGWPQWCEEQLRPESSDFVLMICTQTYLARVENRVPADEGRGVIWEGSLIYSYVYNDKENRRFIPVLLPGSQLEDIPRPLRDHSWYRVEGFTLESPGYEALYRELTGQPAIPKPGLGEVVHLPPLEVAPALPAREVRAQFPAGASPALAIRQEKPDLPSVEEAKERVQALRGPAPPITGDKENRRRVDAVAPTHAGLGETIDLLVQVRMSDSPFLSINDWPFKGTPSSLERASASTALQFPIDQQTGRMTSARLLIRVVAPDFSIRGASKKRLDVPPDRDSELLFFLLKTRKRGACRINVEVCTSARECVGTIPVTTSVNGGTTGQLATVASLIFFVVVPDGGGAQGSTLPSASSGRSPDQTDGDSAATPPSESVTPAPRILPWRPFQALIAVVLVSVLVAAIGIHYALQMRLPPTNGEPGLPVAMPPVAGKAGPDPTHSTAGAAGRSPIVITEVPPTDDAAGPDRIFPIAGRVQVPNPAEYEVVVYAFDGRLWHVQPDTDTPWTEIAKDGSWSTRTHPGVRYAALLVRGTVVPPTQTANLPALGGEVLARDEREN